MSRRVGCLALPYPFLQRGSKLRGGIFIFKSGAVIYSTNICRNNYDVACPMNFKNYPYDTQICKVKYESCEFPNSPENAIVKQPRQDLFFLRWVHHPQDAFEMEEGI